MGNIATFLFREENYTYGLRSNYKVDSKNVGTFKVGTIDKARVLIVTLNKLKLKQKKMMRLPIRLS